VTDRKRKGIIKCKECDEWVWWLHKEATNTHAYALCKACGGMYEVPYAIGAEKYLKSVLRNGEEPRRALPGRW